MLLPGNFNKNKNKTATAVLNYYIQLFLAFEKKLQKEKKVLPFTRLCELGQMAILLPEQLKLFGTSPRSFYIEFEFKRVNILIIFFDISIRDLIKNKNLTDIGVVPCILLAKSHGKPTA